MEITTLTLMVTRAVVLTTSHMRGGWLTWERITRSMKHILPIEGMDGVSYMCNSWLIALN